MLVWDSLAHILFSSVYEKCFSNSASLITKFLFFEGTLFHSVNLIFYKFILLTCIDILIYKISELYKSYTIIKT